MKNIWNPFIDLYTYMQNELTENEKNKQKRTRYTVEINKKIDKK